MLAGSVVRQALVPMAVFYLILMGALGLGLLSVQRYGTRHRDDAVPPGGRVRPPGWPGRPEGPEGPTDPAAPRGWPALLRHMARVAVPGYLLLMAVVITYYYGVARVDGDFIVAAVTGAALLIGLSMPVYAAAAWLARRLARRRDRRAEPTARQADGARHPPPR